MRLQPGTVALIKDLAEAGWPLAILSNAPGELADAVSRATGSKAVPAPHVQLPPKSAKPDPECFGAALALLGAQADEVIFLDDRDDNVAAAAALGVRSVQFTDPARARAAVTAHLTELG